MANAEVTKTAFGKMPDGTPVDVYTLKSARVEARIISYGAKLISVKCADRNGKMADVVLGYDSLESYLQDAGGTYFGAIVGRYGNRIAKGKFELDGTTYQIPLNDKGNALHGGTKGFDQAVWSAHEVPNGVALALESKDGEMGFPGNLTVHVRYTLIDDVLHIDYSAKTDKDTVLNLTNHAYFNLHGDDQGNVLDHEIMIDADTYTPVDAGLIPTGELAPVAGTPMDFRKPTAIGARIDAGTEQLKLAGGYDQNWVVNGAMGTLRTAAVVYDPKSGRTLTVATTEPGVQFYSGNFLNGTRTGRHGGKYPQHSGFCLETQHFPDSPNQPNFPTTELKPGHLMRSSTTYTFSVRK